MVGRDAKKCLRRRAFGPTLRHSFATHLTDAPTVSSRSSGYADNDDADTSVSRSVYRIYRPPPCMTRACAAHRLRGILNTKDGHW